MFRKILWILVAIAAGAGLLLCIAGLIGVWVANSPLTEAITATSDTAESYLTLAGNTTTTAGSELADLRTQLEAIGARMEGMTAETRSAAVAEATTAFEQRFGPTISTLRTTFATVRTGIVALNQSLESANRIPGVTVPTLTDELQVAEQRIDTLEGTFSEIQSALTDANVDGSRLKSLIAAASAEVASIEQVVNQWNSQIAVVAARITSAAAAAPGIVDLTSVVLSLLFVLFGAGQVSLLLRAIDAVRGPKTPA